MKSLSDFQREYPELTFDNSGYEYLSKDIQDKYAVQIAEIESILKEVVEGFVEFNNFKPRKDGSVDVRVQYKWDEHFTGVGYFPLADVDAEIRRLNRSNGH